MFSVAIIGSDGAGKSTVARRLQAGLPLPMKCLYMGINLDSSNVALPGARFLQRLRRGHSSPTLHVQSGGTQRRSRFWSALVLVYRLLDECYRQLLSLFYQKTGHVVVYDRHFRFDFAGGSAQSGLADRLHRWFLVTLYPTPDLTLFLDAPAEVLFARKHEASLEWLDARRQALLAEGRNTPNFFRVDATQPLESVFIEVRNHILSFAAARSTAPADAQMASRTGNGDGK